MIKNKLISASNRITKFEKNNGDLIIIYSQK